jgi:hypothetical protein
MISVTIPEAYRVSRSEGVVKASLFDQGWMRSLPRPDQSSITGSNELVPDTTFFTLLEAASKLNRFVSDSHPEWARLGTSEIDVLVDKDPYWIGGIPFVKNDMTTSLRGLLDKGALKREDVVRPPVLFYGDPKPVWPGKAEQGFAEVLSSLASGWVEELREHQANSHSFGTPELLPFNRAEKSALLTTLLSLDGFGILQARLRTDRLLRGGDFFQKIADHVDADLKAKIDRRLQSRRGSIGEPLARLWQALCFLTPDQTVEKMGVEVISERSGNSLISRLKMEDRLFMCERRPLDDLLAIAEQAGCRGFVSVGETLIGATPDPEYDGLFEIDTLSLTCVQVASQATLLHDLFRVPRVQSVLEEDPSPVL